MMKERQVENLTKRYNRKFYIDEKGKLRDSLWDSKEFQKIEKIVNQKVEEELKKTEFYGMLGSCHMFWGRKREILKQEYNIDWVSPAEMNPHILYD